MKKRFALFALLIMMAQLNSFAQNRQTKITWPSPLITDEGITDITASDNIDLVLIQDSPENVSVKVPDYVLGKLKVSIDEGKLFLAPAKNLKTGERLTVYVWINELESLTLKGNAFATSTRILQNKNLHISVSEDASFSLKSKSKVWFNAGTNYQVVKEDGYFSVYALQKMFSSLPGNVNR
jgi:hypothetical protein